MKFKVGDKVKFLNESGGGVVARIISPSLVSVAIQEGFEIPVLSSEILKIEEDAPVDSPKHMFREDFDIDISQSSDESKYSGSGPLPLIMDNSRGKMDPGIYLAYVPHDQKWLVTGMVDVNLVNFTGYDILYSVMREDEELGFVGEDYGSCGPNTMALIQTVDREQLPEWTKGVVQVLFHKDRDNKVLSPANSLFRVKPTRFYNETSYKDTPLLHGKAIMVSLAPLAAQLSALQSQAKGEQEKAEPEIKVAEVVEPIHMIDKHKTSPKEAVVDLHIYELVDDYENMQNHEMLGIQKNYFIGCLESAIANKLSKVTFIHGVGKGSLKNEILNILKDYPQVEARDASMAGFGYGATEVIIRQKGQ